MKGRAAEGVPQPGSERTHVLEVIGNGIVGGMEHCVLRLIEHLPRPDFRVTVLCPWESAVSNAARSLGVDVHVVSMPESLNWESVHFTATLVRALEVDVLHAHLSNAHVLAGTVGSLADRPVLATVHGRQLSMLDLETHRSTRSHLGVVCRNSYFHALGVGVSPASLHLLPNGVDARRFRPAETGDQATGAFRASLELSGNGPLVAFIGRLAPEKGPDVFVRAAAFAARACPQATFLVIGDGPMRNDLQSLATSLGARSLRFLGVRHDIESLLRDIDLVVSTSHSEASPLALMEAMATGKPIVATSVGGVPELVQQGETGLVLPPGQPEAIGMAITDMLRDVSRRARMGTAARERVLRAFALEDSVEATARVLSDLARKSAAPERRLNAVRPGA